MRRRCGYLAYAGEEALECCWPAGHENLHAHAGRREDGTLAWLTPMPEPANSRPPLGVMPRTIWLKHRASALAGAIEASLEHSSRTGGRPVAELLGEWATELANIFAELKR